MKVCKLEDIPKLGARRYEHPSGETIAIFRTAADTVFALADKCPHKGGPLSQGIVFGESVACPLHNWSIGLADGCAKAPDEGCTVRFQVKLDAEGAVALDRHELATLGLDLAAPVAGPCAGSGAAGDRSVDVQAPQAR
jgi:nitrite reductase [NAD(P)H] small subunit